MASFSIQVSQQHVICHTTEDPGIISCGVKCSAIRSDLSRQWQNLPGNQRKGNLLVINGFVWVKYVHCCVTFY